MLRPKHRTRRKFVAFVGLGWAFLRARNQPAARRLFLASIIYLPVLLGLMVIDMDDRAVRGGEFSVASSDSATSDIEVATNLPEGL